MLLFVNLKKSSLVLFEKDSKLPQGNIVCEQNYQIQHMKVERYKRGSEYQTLESH